MPIPEKVVAEVVKEAGVKMRDPKYASTLVGTWVQTQPEASRYVTAHARELGGAEGVVNVCFHASLMAACFLRHHGRSVRKMTYADLDFVSSGDREAALKKRQPALLDYLTANVESDEMRKVLVLLALGLDHAF
jgi:hypothetical protein